MRCKCSSGLFGVLWVGHKRRSERNGQSILRKFIVMLEAFVISHVDKTEITRLFHYAFKKYSNFINNGNFYILQSQKWDYIFLRVSIKCDSILHTICKQLSRFFHDLSAIQKCQDHHLHWMCHSKFKRPRKSHLPTDI